jgi:hypothetical protein
MLDLFIKILLKRLSFLPNDRASAVMVLICGSTTTSVDALGQLCIVVNFLSSAA